ncbi:MAG: zeta toxin family protein [Alphaproteobacteria bacterium]
MSENANWYVPSLNTANVELPEGLYITMFDEKNHTSDLTSEQIKTEYERNAKAIGEYVLSLSPERLALHETIVAISTNLKVQSEDNFVDTFHKIYNEEVLPMIESKKTLFAAKQKMIKTDVESQASIYFDKNSSENCTMGEDFSKYLDKYNKNLSKYKEELAILEEKTKEERPSRDERAKIKELKEITSFMEDNKERIIVDIVINAKTLEANSSTIKNLISGEKGLFNSEYMDNFDKLTQHSAEDRKAYLVVGGAASGKGSVTTNAKNSQDDPQDLLELNPDLYKKLLLSFDVLGENRELHGSLTHAESSIVFDMIAERWQNNAENGSATNILMDVARAGSWQLDVLSSGGTEINANTPVLPIATALERSYRRGEQTGRFMPTMELIQGHKEQLDLNLNAMKKGVSYKFYDTNVNFGDPTPLIAEYNPKTEEMKISDMNAMYDYFSKGKLNPNARSIETLSSATPKSTSQAMIEHAEIMDIKMFNKDKEIAKLTKGGQSFEVTDWNALKQQMGEEQATNLLQGLFENKVKIKGNEELKEVMENIIAQTKKSEKDSSTTDKTIKNMAAEEYASLLENLIEKGVRVGKTESVYVYDFAQDEELKDKAITIQTQNLDVLSEEARQASSNQYDPEKVAKKQMLLVIDPKVYNTQEKRDALIAKMKRSLRFDDTFKAEGVYMNERGKLSDDYIQNENSSSGVLMLKPNPEAVRIAHKITDKACRIPVQWGTDGYAIEKDGSIVIREKDLTELEVALAKYKQDKDPNHLLTEEGKAILDVYGTDPFFVEDNYSNVYSDVKYKQFAQKLLSKSELKESKNATNYEDVYAYQLKENERVVAPDGKLIKEGDWLAIPKDSLKDLEKDIALDRPISSEVHAISKSTMQKSYINNKEKASALTKPDTQRV